MTPADLALVEADLPVLTEHGDRFAAEFYATLFELAPELRSMFPTDMAAQRRKLFDELSVLVERARQVADAASVDAFVERARDLGDRHDGYGVTAPMYRVVEVALLAAVREVVPRHDLEDAHQRAWTRLYRMVAGAMKRA